MASINGITVKSLKKFRGHEGEPLYQGNIYLGNKKIGWWSQDSHGGCDNIHLDEQYNVSKLEGKVRLHNLNKETTHTRRDGSTFTLEYSLDRLFGDLMELKIDEDMFKDAIKNGFTGLLLVTDGYHVFGWNLSEKDMEHNNDAILRKFHNAIEDGKKEHKFYKEDGFTKHEIKIYRSADDFKVGKAISLNDIKR